MTRDLANRTVTVHYGAIVNGLDYLVNNPCLFKTTIIVFFDLGHPSIFGDTPEFVGYFL